MMSTSRPSIVSTILTLSVCCLFTSTLVSKSVAYAPPPTGASVDQAQMVPGEVLVQVTPSAFAGDYRASLGTSGRTGVPSIDAALQTIGALEIRPVFERLDDPTAQRAAGMDRILRVPYSSSIAPDEAAKLLLSSSDVAFAEPNYIAHALLTPNDPTYPLQWAHNNTGQAISYTGGSVGTPDCDTDTDQAWDLQTGSSSFILSIVDTGVDTGHPEFAGRIVAGYDYVNNDSNPTDDNGHGTCCAGIAAGGGNDGIGPAGVAWNVKIMPVKVLNASGNGAYTAVANGINFAANNGAKILSLSLGGPASSTLQTAVDYAVNTKGCAMFAATGNANASALDYPAAYSNVISVGALSPCNERKNPSSCDGENWWGSNYGTGIDFMAPGVRIHCADIRGAGGFGSGDYISNFNGTSSATPHAAGVGALVWSQNPALTNSGLLGVLQTNCDDLGTAGYDTQTGYGRLNAYRAVQNASGGGGGGGTPVTLFSEGFEVNVVPGSVWGANDSNATNGSDYWGDQSSSSGARVHAGSWSAYCADNSNVSGQRYDHYMDAYMTKSAAVGVSGYTNLTFSFWLWYTTYNSSDYLALQYWSGSAWVEAQRWSGTAGTTWTQYSYTLTGFTSFQWRWLFHSNSASNAEGAYVDDIALVGTTAAAPPSPIMALIPVDARAPEGASDGQVSLRDGDGAALGGDALEFRANPNPAGEATSLSFALATASDVSVEVFRADGARVARLFDGTLDAGSHQLAWSGRNDAGDRLAAGVYWARLSVDSMARATQRIVLLEP